MARYWAGSAGFITCRAEGQEDRRLPLEDVRAVIIAARGVTLTSNFLSGLLETDGIVLHCDERYQPCGWTAPLGRVVDLQAFQHQTARPSRLNDRLWQEMLRGKTLNQTRVLQRKQLRSPHLELALQAGRVRRSQLRPPLLAALLPGHRVDGAPSATGRRTPRPTRCSTTAMPCWPRSAIAA